MSVFGPVADAAAERIREKAKDELLSRMVCFLDMRKATEISEIAAWVRVMGPSQIIEWHQLLDCAKHKPGESWR